MIIIYDKANGKLIRFITGTCLNANTFDSDGYLNIQPGGQSNNPEIGQGVFNLDENSDPVLGNNVAKAIYDENNRYYISEINSATSLVESV